MFFLSMTVSAAAMPTLISPPERENTAGEHQCQHEQHCSENKQ
jgi:hypothetical protein